jgi:TPR repeat protein
MKTHLLIMLAASTLGGCAMAQQATSGVTQSVTSLFQRVAQSARSPAPEAAPVAAAERPAEQPRAHGDDRFRLHYAMALTGDRDAMVEVARIYARGSNGIARDERLMVEWLRQASERRHAGASYLLYQYYLERGMDRDALRYEATALRQGYILPARLDPRRG